MYAVSQRSWIQHLFNCRTGKRIALIVSFAKCLISVKKTRRTDGHRMTAYTACIASRGKYRHFYVPRPLFFVSPGDAFAIITQYVAWMEKQFNACQTPRSIYLSIFNTFRVIRPKIAIFTTFLFPLGTPLGQSR